VLQYVIRDPAEYLFRLEAPQALVEKLAEGVLTQTVVGMPVDEVLTTGRLAIQTKVKTETQAILDRYRSGIQLSTVNIMSISFDKSVAQAFQEVADAMADREKVQNEARAYANDQIPKARGEAHRVLGEAQNYKQQRIAEAIGNANRFRALTAEYDKAPDVTRQRLYLEAMEKILPKVKMYVIDSQGGRVPLNLRVTNP
jgi:membrane protease subunit HflK